MNLPETLGQLQRSTSTKSNFNKADSFLYLWMQKASKKTQKLSTRKLYGLCFMDCMFIELNVFRLHKGVLQPGI